MKNFFYILAAFALISGPLAFADLNCGETKYDCLDVATKASKYNSKQLTRFCSVDDYLTREQAIEKLSYYELCASYGGLVIMSSIN